MMQKKGLRNIKQMREDNAGLRKKCRNLVRSNRDLEQFAYVVSHDLQEPLRAVSSFLQLLQQRLRKKLDRESREYLNFAIDGSERMKNLLISLLKYSRVKKTKSFEKIEPEMTLNDVMQDLREIIKTNNATIKKDILPAINGDKVLIHQLFHNLIANGIKFRRKEDPEITITAQERDAHWLFSVSDNGIGIGKENYDKIFVIFQRLYSSKEFPGTGIGLAICKKIVEHHGGKIWVKSELGHGSSFYFTLRK